MARESDKLNTHTLAAEVRAEVRLMLDPATRPAKLKQWGDGGGLYLVMTSAGKARWLHKFQWNGKTAERMFPGEFPDTLSLTAARTMRNEDRILLTKKINPIAANAKRVVPSFADYCRANAQELATDKKRKTWLRQMTANPAGGFDVGKLALIPIDEIKLSDVKAVMAPIWTKHPGTAKHLLSGIRVAVRHYRINTNPDDERVNPADQTNMETALNCDLNLRSVPRAALDWPKVPAFMAALGDRPQMAARLLEFVILAGCRINEAAHGRWEEIDFKARTFTVPAVRMKTEDDVSGKPHVIPLTDAMLRVLEAAKPPGGIVDPSAVIFPSRKGTPISERQVLSHVHAIAGKGVATTHGFRSALTDWGCSAGVEYPSDVMLSCIAHAVGTKADRSYLRDRWLDRRRPVMEAWSAFVSGGDVVPFRAAA